MQVLSGNFDQSDHIVFPQFYGRQCTANSAAAACKTAIIHPSAWVPSTIDDCLFAGDDLFKKSLDKLKEKGQNPHYLCADELFPTITYPDATKV